eukprot:159820-Chlamydomonas_euryale.AAC.13
MSESSPKPLEPTRSSRCTRRRSASSALTATSPPAPLPLRRRFAPLEPGAAAAVAATGGAPPFATASVGLAISTGKLWSRGGAGRGGLATRTHPAACPLSLPVRRTYDRTSGAEVSRPSAAVAVTVPLEPSSRRTG